MGRTFSSREVHVRHMHTLNFATSRVEDLVAAESETTLFTATPQTQILHHGYA